MPEWWVLVAQSGGELSPGGYRVVASAGGNTTQLDFSSIDAARQYADDVASEGDYPDAMAIVLDAELNVVHRGRHYAAGKAE